MKTIYCSQKLDYQRSLFRLLLIVVFVHVLLTVLLASVPPISRDALIHHLTIPKMYLLHGSIYEIPSMHFSYFPMNLDLIYLLPLHWGFDIGAKYIHYSFALLTAGLIYRYLRRYMGQLYGIVGALLFLTTPIILKLSVTAYVDLGLIFFSWATQYFIFRWIDSDFSNKYLILSGVTCGLGLGTKYNGMILLFIVAVLVPLIYSRISNKHVNPKDLSIRNINSIIGLKHGVIFTLIALIFFCPWGIRNWNWVHNPIYPLYNSFFNPPKIQQPVTISTGKEKKSNPRNSFWLRKHVYKESFLQTITIPIRAFFQGQDDNPKFFDGKLNPFLFALPFFAFIRLKSSPPIPPPIHRNILTVFSLLFILFVLFTSDFRIRYMAPTIPAIVILTVFGIDTLWRKAKEFSNLFTTFLRALLCVTIFAALFYNGNYIKDQFSFIRPYEYLSGEIDRNSYIARYRKEHPVMMYANKNLPQDASVLCLSVGDRTYYLDRNVHLAEGFYNRINGDYSEENLLKTLQKHGTTHIIIDTNVYQLWLKGLPLYEQAIFKNVFSKHTKIMYETNGIQLLRFSRSQRPREAVQ